MKDQYVILTGSKNNAGDYLIKYRAKQLFANLRPDRKIIDINGWEQLNAEKLTIINESKALILMGGPALIKNMVPKVYALTHNLEDIKVPIIMMGIGWKSQKGNWEDTYSYSLSEKTLCLLNRIDNSGYQSSLRDYHTMNACRFNGFTNFLMTGCPAYYDKDFIDKELQLNKINKVAFSLGVAFVESPSMEKLMKENILACKAKFSDKEFEVVFHHSLDVKKFKDAYKAYSIHLNKHNEFADWLQRNNIKFIDISGSAENLTNYYASVDFHVGYRVHAHIFMNSIAKQSILISEDGRAKGVKSAISGIVLDGYLDFKDSFVSKVLNKLLPFYERFKANNNLTKELFYEIDYEKEIDFRRLKNSRKQIDNNYRIMKQFLKQLP
jgi:hypothetical protein